MRRTTSASNEVDSKGARSREPPASAKAFLGLASESVFRTPVLLTALLVAASCSGTSAKPITSVAVTACTGVNHSQILGLDFGSGLDQAVSDAMRSRDSHLVSLVATYRRLFREYGAGSNATYAQAKAWVVALLNAQKYCHDRYDTPPGAPLSSYFPRNTPSPPDKGKPTSTTTFA